MAAEVKHLHGACACERNQYNIIVPPEAASQAQVFLDNSIANRRAQATPVSAWLRVPLDWYHSATIAQFPDETHSSIKRSFSTASHPAVPTTRRQFCGYCGTHLTAWHEESTSTARDDTMLDVTLGSLLGESLTVLEELGLFDADDEEDEADSAEQSSGPVLAALGVASPDPMDDVLTRRVLPRGPPHSLRSRGIPWFEEMVENSRMGRIKRRAGGHTSSNGKTSVEWEVVEFEGADEPMLDSGEVAASSSKRQRLGE